MFSVAPEIVALRDSGAITADQALPLIARERREIVSIYAELRFLTWAAVMLIVTGVGVLVKNHLNEIGPLAIALAIALGAAGCYAWAAYKHKREASLVDDYILLLAALLLSADLGYIEHTWHLLGANWKDHLLILAVIHAVTAYIFDSRLVLSVALTSLAAWLGVQRSLDTLFGSSSDTAFRAFICAAIVFAWRLLDARYRKRRTFATLFDHYAANLAFWGALILTGDQELRLLGCTITVALAAASAVYGLKTRSEMFLIYACIYGVIALDIAVALLIPPLASLFIMMSSITAIVALFVIHARMRAAEEA
jgi:hypothetical protein